MLYYNTTFNTDKKRIASISYRPSGREISSLSAYCVCVGHEGRPRAAGPRATRVTYTYAVADKELIERPGR